MSCILCFFDNSYQKKLKRASYNIDTFVERLVHYKNSFMEHFRTLQPITECDCGFRSMTVCDPLYVAFCEEVRKDFQTKETYVEQLFDSLIDIYQAVVAKSPDAENKFFSFIRENSTGYSSNNSAQFTDLLFRARPTGDYDPNNIYELFHIPFSKRHLISSQRFSAARRPMLYLAKSLPTTIAEISLPYDSLNYSLYFPIYSYFYSLGKGMYNITNSIDLTLNQIIGRMILQGSQVQYNNYTFTFSKQNADKLLGDSVLFQVLTFPKKEGSTVIEEYILPQFFTDFLESSGYTGLIYQSTKELREFSSEFKYKSLDYNYCFFIPETEHGDYNEKFLGLFYCVSQGNKDRDRTIEEVKQLLEECRVVIKKSNYLLNEYIILLGNIERHIENMERFNFNGHMYYESELGKIEATLMFSFLLKIEDVVTRPIKFNIILKNESF
ncbi:hypothetical protein [Paenibacillus sp. FSL K6-2524]|uniref:hypothetical protein n=1 Tax=Paenibacillus sp. FSL K6-2524 TaxID=2954516 RepID=UPI0030FA2C44